MEAVKNEFIEKLTNKLVKKKFDCIFRKKVKIQMYEVTYSINGIIKKIDIKADDAITAQALFTNMFGGGAIEIINIFRK